MKAKKPSGANIPESQRHTVRVVIRLSPEIAERLDLLAPRGRRSEFIEKLIMAAPLPRKDRGT